MGPSRYRHFFDLGARPGSGMLGIIEEHDDMAAVFASRSCANRRRADYNASRVCIGAAIIGAVAIRAAGQRRQGHDYSCDQPQ